MTLEQIAQEEKIKTEEGINLDDPFVKLFRKVMLEHAAKNEKSDLYCPQCKTNLPYTNMTVATVHDGFDANFNPVGKTKYFCTLCEIYFDKEKRIE